jgi:hypothetical protein
MYILKIDILDCYLLCRRPVALLAIEVFAPTKLEARWHGPYEILRVHVNGTLTIRLTAHTIERVNVRRLKPYRS